MTGREWIVDAYGCEPESLRDRARLEKMFRTLVETLQLRPAGDACWRQFPEPGGVTGIHLLEESHLTVHTFPEYRSLCLNLFCCRPRPEFNFVMYLGRAFGAESVRVRRLERPYGQLEPAA